MEQEDILNCYRNEKNKEESRKRYTEYNEITGRVYEVLRRHIQRDDARENEKLNEERELIEDINKIIGSEEFFYIIENDNYKREIHEMLEKLQENKCIVGRSGNQLRKMKEKVNHLNAKYERDYLLYKQRIQKNIKTDEQDEKSQFIKERILSKKMFNIFCNVKWDFEN